MIRLLGWVVIYCAMLGYASIHAEYKDGLKINLYGWGEKIKRNRKKPE